MNEEERAYNLEEFAAAAPSPANPGQTMAAKVGVAAPEFEAVELDGSIVRLSDFRGRRHVVVMTGAVTSPMCALRRRRSYSERVVPHEADQATHRRIYERAGPKAFEDYWAKRPQNRNRWP